MTTDPSPPPPPPLPLPFVPAPEQGQGDLQGQQERVRQSYANNGLATAFRSVLMYRMDVFSVDYENTKVNRTDLVYAQYTYICYDISLYIIYNL